MEIKQNENGSSCRKHSLPPSVLTASSMLSVTAHLGRAQRSGIESRTRSSLSARGYAAAVFLRQNDGIPDLANLLTRY